MSDNISTASPLRMTALTLLAVSGALFLLAPLAMPAGYSWVSNSISESAGQGLAGAWVTRLGFLCMGLGAILSAIIRWPVWKSLAGWLLSAFGFLMLCVAAFSTKQWTPNIPFNALENTLHSVAAMAMGFCYGVGVFVVILVDKRASIWMRVLGWAAVFSSIASPILAGLDPSHGGLYQRLMFAVAIVWFMGQSLNRQRQSSQV